jgi:hypothetical protein
MKIEECEFPFTKPILVVTGNFIKIRNLIPCNTAMIRITQPSWGLSHVFTLQYEMAQLPRPANRKLGGTFPQPTEWIISYM